MQPSGVEEREFGWIGGQAGETGGVKGRWVRPTGLEQGDSLNAGCDRCTLST